MRSLAYALLIGATIHTGAAGAQTQTPASPPQSQSSEQADRQYFERIGATFSHAWNTRNARALDAVLASDSFLVNPLGRIASGKRDVERLIQQDIGAIDDTETRFTLTRARKVSPTVAVLDFRHQWSKGAFNGEDHAEVTMIAAKKGDRWEVRDLRVMVPATPQQRGVGGSGQEAPREQPGQWPQPYGGSGLEGVTPDPSEAPPIERK